MIMKKYMYLFLLILLVSCIEELDPVNTSFEKFYGYNLSSDDSGLLKLENGNLLVYGSAIRTSMSTSVTDETFARLSTLAQDAEMPFFIEVDENGNEIRKAMFPLGNFDYSHNFYELFGVESLNTELAWFKKVIQLNDGSLMAITSVVTNNFFWVEDIVLIISPEDFQVKELYLMHNSETEFVETEFVHRGIEKCLKKDDGSVLCLTDSEYYPPYEGGYRKFYSIIEFAEDGQINRIFDFDNDLSGAFFMDFVIENEGNITLIHGNFTNPNLTFVKEININTGNILSENSVEIPANYDFILRANHLLLRTENGYAIHAQDRDTFSPLYLFDNSFTLLDSTNYINKQGVDDVCYINGFIPLKDGGFCSLGYPCEGNSVITKLDQEGKILWEFYEAHNNLDGNLTGHLMETEDGGILHLSTKNFNNSGAKLRLLKLDRNGKISN